ncbi:MAG TPA: Rieske (2Fe-2S) protein [Geothrix sp.]|nr:Rieske (2Fe-2S) protein [Geothrix sp.]
MSQPDPPLPTEAGTGFDRRTFCACALAMAAASAFSGCGGGGGGSSYSAPPPPPPPPPPPSPISTTETKAGLLAQPDGTVRDYTISTNGACPLQAGAAQGYYLIRDGAGIYAISASCLHQGGHIDPSSGGFGCPCHGSQYNLNGTVTVGPATIGATLQHYEVSESTPGGTLVIDPTKPVAATARLS